MNQVSTPAARTSGRTIGAIVLVVVAAALIILGAIYWAVPAGSIPSPIPGHIPGSTGHHPLRIVGSFVLALACLGGAWFLTKGRRS